MTFLASDRPDSTRAMVAAIIADNSRFVPIPIEISCDGRRVWNAM